MKWSGNLKPCFDLPCKLGKLSPSISQENKFCSSCLENKQITLLAIYWENLICN